MERQFCKGFDQKAVKSSLINQEVRDLLIIFNSFADSKATALSKSQHSINYSNQFAIMNIQKITLFACAFLFSMTLMAQKPLPSAEIKTLEGETLNLTDLGKSGKITVISFWATWCKPCNNELDAIAEVYEEWQDEYDMELVAITIDTRRAFAKVPGWVETKRWDYRVLHGNETDMQNAFNFQTIPQTILVDQKGNVVYTHNGYQEGDEIELEEKIAELAK